MASDQPESRPTGSGAGPPAARIRVEAGFYEGMEWMLDQPRMIVGRGRHADLVVSEPTISRTHAALCHEEGQWFVEDLDSTNGILVNGARKGRAPLQDGDEIQLGRLLLRIYLKEQSEESTGA